MRKVIKGSWVIAAVVAGVLSGGSGRASSTDVVAGESGGEPPKRPVIVLAEGGGEPPKRPVIVAGRRWR